MFQGGSYMACTIIATSMLEQKVSYSGIKVSSSQAVVAITSHFPGIHKTVADVQQRKIQRTATKVVGHNVVHTFLSVQAIRQGGSRWLRQWDIRC